MIKKSPKNTRPHKFKSPKLPKIRQPKRIRLPKKKMLAVGKFRR